MRQYSDTYGRTTLPPKKSKCLFGLKPRFAVGRSLQTLPHVAIFYIWLLFRELASGRYVLIHHKFSLTLMASPSMCYLRVPLYLRSLKRILRNASTTSNVLYLVQAGDSACRFHKFWSHTIIPLPFHYALLAKTSTRNPLGDPLFLQLNKSCRQRSIHSVQWNSDRSISTSRNARTRNVKQKEGKQSKLLGHESRPHTVARMYILLQHFYDYPSQW